VGAQLLSLLTPQPLAARLATDRGRDLSEILNGQLLAAAAATALMLFTDDRGTFLLIEYLV